MANWLFLVIIGVLATLGGLSGLIFPVAASFTVNLLTGVGLLLAGLFGAIAYWRETTGSDRIWGVLLGVMTFILGVLMVTRPVEGLLTLTMFIAVVLVASGVFKVMLGWQLPQAASKWGVVLSGVLSFILAFIIITGLPVAAAVLPGLLLSIELISYGVGLIFIGFGARSLLRDGLPGGSRDGGSPGYDTGLDISPKTTALKAQEDGQE